MNKWRLLLFSVLGLLQSASAERNFVDGRGRYRSDTRLSIEDPYRVYKPLNEERQLNAPKDFDYRARDAESIAARALRRFKHRELILTDRRRTIEAETYRVHAQSDRRGLRSINEKHDEAARVDERRNRVVNRERNIDHLEKSRDLRRGVTSGNRVNTVETRQYDDITLKKIATNSQDRRVFNRHTDTDHKVSESRTRLIDVRNDRAMPEKRFVNRELLRRTIYEEPERREVRPFARTSIVIKNRINNDVLGTRLSLKNDNTRNMEISRLNIFRQHVPSYDVTKMETRTDFQRNSIIRDNDAKNNVRGKRSIDSRLGPAIHLYCENYERRNVRFGSNDENVRQCNSRKLSNEKRVIEVCHTRNDRNNRLLDTRRDPTYITLTLTQEEQSRMPSNRGRVNEIQRTSNIRDSSQNLIRENSITRDLRNTNDNQGVASLARRESSLTRQSPIYKRSTPESNDKQRNIYRSVSIEERVGRQRHIIRNARDESTNIRREIALSKERQYLISKIPATMELIGNTDNFRRVSYRRTYSEDRVLYEIQNTRNTLEENLRYTRRLLNKERYAPSQKIRDIQTTENTPEIHQDRFRRLSAGKRTENEIQRVRNARDERNINRRINDIENVRQERSRSSRDERLVRGQRIMNDIRHNRQAGEKQATNAIRRTSNIREESVTNEIVHARNVLGRLRDNRENVRQERPRSSVRDERLVHGQRTRNAIRQNRQVSEKQSTNAIRRTRNVREESVTNEHATNVHARNVQEKPNDNRENVRQERLRSSVRDERLVHVQRTWNDIRHNRQADEKQVTKSIRRTSNVREESVLYGIVHVRNVQERLSLQRLNRLTRNSQHTNRPASERSMDDTRRETSRSLSTEKREVNEVQQTRNVRENRLMKTNEMQRNSYTRDVRETIDIRINSDVLRATNENRRTKTTRHEILRNRDTQVERARNEVQRSRNFQEERLSSARRIMVAARQGSTNANKIQLNRYRSTSSREKGTDKRQFNRNGNQEEYMLSASLFREDKRSMIQFSTGPIPVKSTEIGSTFVLKWQYLFYMLQGIYLFSLFRKMPKENSEFKKNRAADWITMLEFLKIH
ncbi:uncharacterized protein LOC112045310 [Bicyclus anynana]|uniref:Uncharacterized protein LOC112045310 n=1 Tax=Bicyclus anynana TaxID=110368 RepID=A0A6J1MRS1_BICAN|nr:uncharacterized protein LOC112045310 [Bicyclus anynana]